MYEIDYYYHIWPPIILKKIHIYFIIYYKLCEKYNKQ